MFAGGQILSGFVDEQLLLPVDDRDETLCVYGADVTGMQPAVGVDGFRGLLGLMPVATHHDRPAYQ